ncbi:MAG: OmpA family protein [Cytophagaceae bacterium]|nr:OmpA family protein [Cytophagaceae bacterium]MDW8455942.1 OmpA family protein [Cytophagaceae bacterium]
MNGKVFSCCIFLASFFTIQGQPLLSGNWTGTLYQNPSSRTPYTEYKFSMKLEERNGTVTGTSTIVAGIFFGEMELEGSWQDNIFRFAERAIKNTSETKDFLWCIKKGELKLTLQNNIHYLIGKWEGYTIQNGMKISCSPGTIVLKKELNSLSVRGSITDSTRFIPVAAIVKIVNTHTGEEVRNFSCPAGMFDIKLPAKCRYEIIVQSKGYYTRNEVIHLDQPVNLNILLTPIKVGSKIELKHVFFERGTNILIDESYNELRKLGIFLKDNPTVVIQLEGHTSAEGNATDNMKLSEDRVNTIKEYLMKEHDIEDWRIKTKAYGSSKPIASNDTEENRRKNRRVEFVILSK